MATVKKTTRSTAKSKARPKAQAKTTATAKAKKPTATKAENSKLVSRHAVLGFSSRRVWPD